MEQLKLNMIPNGVNPVFHASQYDKGRQIRFVLDETLSGAEVIVSYRAKDGTEYGNVQMSVSGNTITDTIPEEVLTDYGIIEGEVNIDGIGSLNFFVEVEKDAYDGGVITTQTATGAIATFETNIETAFVSLKTDINPVQDLHGYSKPWSGGSGKNKLENTSTVTSLNSVTFTKNEDGSVKLTGTASAAINSTYINFFTLPSGTYIFTDGTTSTNCYLYLLIEGSGTWYKNGDTFTVDGNTRTRVVAYVANGSATNLTLYPMIRLSSVSDASFEPYSNICPISGFSALNITRTGVNLCYQVISGASISGGGQIVSEPSYAMGCALLKKGVTYTVTTQEGQLVGGYFSSSPTIGSIAFDNTRFVLSNKTITPTKDCYIAFRMPSNYTTQPQVNIGSTALPYVAYNGQTATVNFGQTVYGGSLDVTNGKVNVAYAKKKINELTWNYVNIAGSERFYSTSLSTVIEKPTTIDNVSTLKCSCYETVSERQYAQFTSNNIIAVQTTGFIVIRDTNYTSVSDLLNAVGNQEICYPLATPTEITTTSENLTAIVGENNNVYSDTNGDTTVEYYIEV